MADNYKDALEVCYFKEENEKKWKQIYLESQFPTTLSYKIQKIIPLNANLYEITSLYEYEKEYVKGLHYVGYINGQYYFIINQRDIPDSIRENCPLQEDVIGDESDRETIMKPSLLPHPRQGQLQSAYWTRGRLNPAPVSMCQACILKYSPIRFVKQVGSN